MREHVFTIKNKLGLHAKPAALFVQTATRFKCSIMVDKDGTEVNGKSIMGLMLLAAEGGSKVKIRFDGPDEAEAQAALGKLFDAGFEEL